MSPERPVVIDCHGERLTGVLHPGSPQQKTGLLIIVGGPQYRVGSHRQFVLMARAYAAAGFTTLRFDYRGMGDSGGDLREFDTVDDDIRAAIDCLLTENPHLENIVLVGLCDAASAALMYASTDSRVAGQVLLNPWVRSEQGEARSYLRHYYLQRLMQKSFWVKLVRGEMKLFRSAREFLGSVQQARQSEPEADLQSEHFIARMLRGLKAFGGPVLFVICERDLTAGEFTGLCRDDKGWRSATRKSHVNFELIEGADHTLSKRKHLDYVNSVVLNWLNYKINRS